MMAVGGMGLSRDDGRVGWTWVILLWRLREVMVAPCGYDDGGGEDTDAGRSWRDSMDPNGLWTRPTSDGDGGTLSVSRLLPYPLSETERRFGFRPPLESRYHIRRRLPSLPFRSSLDIPVTSPNSVIVPGASCVSY